MTTWTVETIERDVLSGKVSTIARAESEVVEAVERAQRLLGKEWIAAQIRNQKGLVPAIRMFGMGLQLQAIEGLPGSEKLLTKLRNLDSSADAELTAIHLFRSGADDVEIELFPLLAKKLPISG